MATLPLRRRLGREPGASGTRRRRLFVLGGLILIALGAMGDIWDCLDAGVDSGCVFVISEDGTNFKCVGPGDVGDGGPTPTAVPTPPPSHTWLLLPGCCGLYSEWGTTQYSNGGPDHHDGAPTEHAVDIGAGSCSTCPNVFYYDLSNSVTTAVAHFPSSCVGGTGGERVELTLTSFDPSGVYEGTAVYRHLTGAIQSGSPVDGTFLGTVNPITFGGSCSTGPHLHEGIDHGTSSATIAHYTGVKGSGSNCEGYPPDPVTFNQQAHSDVPCYALSW